MNEIIENKSIEKSTKYRVLVNYLKKLIEEETYVSVKELTKILKALEEVE